MGLGIATVSQLCRVAALCCIVALTVCGCAVAFRLWGGHDQWRRRAAKLGAQVIELEAEMQAMQGDFEAQLGEKEEGLKGLWREHDEECREREQATEQMRVDTIRLLEEVPWGGGCHGRVLGAVMGGCRCDP